MAYDAFISYSHAADGRLAPALQVGLQRLARPWNRARALRVFRDDTNLAVNPHLWESIQQALDESEYFVLLASPEAAASRWVNRELEHWIATKPVERVLPVLTDGALAWDPDQDDYDIRRSTALPHALAGRFATEPRHLDLRWARDETQLDLRHARFRDAVADLAAPMHNLPKDELESEDVRQHRRTVRLARAASGLLVLLLGLAGALGGFAVQQRARAGHQSVLTRREANAARSEARRARSQRDRANAALRTASAGTMAAQAINAVHDGRTDLGLLLAVEAYHLAPDAVTRGSLLTALLDQPSLRRELHGLTDATSRPVFAPDGHLVAASSESGEIIVWDVRTGRPLDHHPAVPAGVADVTVNGFADDGRLLVSTWSDFASSTKVTTVWDVTTGAAVHAFPVNETAVATAAAAPTIATADGKSGAVSVVDARTGEVRGALPGVSGAIWTLRADGALAAAMSVPPLTEPPVLAVQTWRVTSGQSVGPPCRRVLDASFITDPGMPSFAGSTAIRVVQPANGDELVARCDADTGSMSLAKLSLGAANRSVTDVSPDDRIIVSRDAEDGTINLFDSKTHAQVGATLRAPLLLSAMSTVNGTVVFSPDGQLVTATEDDGTLRLWSARATLPPMGQLGSPLQNLDDSWLTQSRDGHVGMISRVVAGVSSIDVVDLSTNLVLHKFARAQSSALSDDGKVAAASDAASVVVFDADHNTTVSIPRAQLACNDPSGFSLRGIAVSSNPAAIAIACREGNGGAPNAGIVQRVDITGRRWRVEQPTATTVWPDILGYSPNGRVLVAQMGSSGSSALQLLDVASDGLRPGRVISNAGSWTFTPDSKYLLTNKGHVTIWRLGADPQRSDFSGATDGGDLSVSPDGSLITATSRSGAVTLWDRETGTVLGTLPGPLGQTAGNANASVRDNGTVLSSDDHSLTETIALFPASPTVPLLPTREVTLSWDLDPQSWGHLACAIANRDLSRAEWEQYAPGISSAKICP